MKHKLFSLFAALCCTICINAQTSGTCGDNLRWSYNTSTKVLTITGSGAMTDYDRTTTSFSVTTPWKSYSIQSVSLPEGLTSIGNYAFYQQNMKSVTIPNSVTRIGDYAFNGCSRLSSITLPNSVTNIGTFVFQYCTGLTSPLYNTHVFAYMPNSYSGSYSIPDGIETIASGAFQACHDLTAVTIPNSVTSIGSSAFSGSGLTTVTIPNSVTSIGSAAFLGCSGLTSVTIGNSVTSIGERAFEGCSFTSMTIPNGVTIIEDNVFYQCKNLKTIAIPNNVTSIGKGTFTGCTSLKTVTIPNSVTSIGSSAFAYCTKLTSITIPNSVTNMGKSVFYACGAKVPLYNTHVFAYMPESYSGPYTIPDGIKTIAGGAFYDCTLLTSITIPNSVTSIGEKAFISCTSLKLVNVPNSVTSVGESAFKSCSSLNAVHILDIAAWCAILFSDDESNPLYYAHNLYLNGNLIKNMVIPNSVTSIGERAFIGCTSLTSVTIPNSVTNIGMSSFELCSSLTSITIPNSITTIGNYAFYDCRGLTSVTCEAVTPPTLANNSFSGVSKTIPVYVPAGSVNAYEKWGGFKNIQPISAGSADVTTNTTSDITENSVAISWPQVAGADQYVIEIRFNNVRVCTITFNDQGQLLSIAFAAPSRLRDRENNAAQALANGWKYTVYGLDADKTYTYSVIAKNSGGTTIDTKTGTFKTLPLSGLEEILSAPNATDSKKILIDGQIYILRDGKAYDLTGKEVQ